MKITQLFGTGGKVAEDQAEQKAKNTPSLPQKCPKDSIISTKGSENPKIEIHEAHRVTLGQPDQPVPYSLQGRLGSSSARAGVENNHEPNTRSEAEVPKVALGQPEQSVPYSLQPRLGNSSARVETKLDADKGTTENYIKRTLDISPKIAGLR